ncbi:MAG: hypothetical protein HQK49_08135 [Oligoflexia bacterium]|nr:hypothetical protein [Oligoflexia bacterium]
MDYQNTSISAFDEVKIVVAFLSPIFKRLKKEFGREKSLQIISDSINDFYQECQAKLAMTISGKGFERLDQMYLALKKKSHSGGETST